MDIFQTEVEATVALSAPQTAQWVQDRVLKFQYSATDPQIVQLINLVPEYPVVDPELRIVTRCSVKSTISNQVSIKVAKDEPPTPLVVGELSALQSYVDIIGVAGVEYLVTSTASDKIFIDADVYYNGQYSAVIQTNVINTITNFLAAIPFDGVVKLLDLEIAIRNTLGVNDVVFNNIRARKDSTALASATYLVENNELIARQWPTISGYIVGETTAGNTLANTLTFIPE
jgi:hypothetical protein